MAERVIKTSGGVQGEITVPGDKSVSHRAVMIGSIAEGKTKITNFLMAEDCLATIDCFKSLGIKISNESNDIIVNGKGLHGLTTPKDVIYTGNSGTTTRLITGILAGQSFGSVVSGDSSIAKRPMRRIIAPLRQMGANISATKDNFCPLIIEKTTGLKAIDYTLPVASAQLKSCIMLAGLYADSVTTIYESLPSRDHTELMLKAYGGNVAVSSFSAESNYQVTPVKGGSVSGGKTLLSGETLSDLCGGSVSGNIIQVSPSKLFGRQIDVPSDISSAAYFIVAALISKNSELIIKNVGINPTRTGIIDVLRQMGGHIELQNCRNDFEPVSDIYVKSSKLKGINIGKEIMPRLIDEIPIIAVAAALAEGKTVISGAEELKVKECDRIAAMVCELSKCGVDIKGTDDGMVICGGESFIGGAEFETYGDHRIAMSMAVAAVFSDKPSKILGSECANISFPMFYDRLESVLK